MLVYLRVNYLKDPMFRTNLDSDNEISMRVLKSIHTARKIKNGGSMCMFDLFALTSNPGLDFMLANFDCLEAFKDKKK